MNKKLNQYWESVTKAFNKITMKQVLQSGDVIHLVIAWSVTSFALFAALILIVNSVQEMRSGNLLTSTTSGAVALLMVVICLAVDRYASPPPPTGGGKNR